MADAKRHHFLPQLYLRHFADAKERFYQIEKTHEPKAIPTKVFKAGSQRNYHTLDWSDQPNDRNTVENLLSKVEGRHDKMLKALAAAPSSLDEWREELISFTTLMYHRVPAFKRDIEHRLSEAVNALGHRPWIMEMVPLSFRRLFLLQISIYKPRANQRMETNR